MDDLVFKRWVRHGHDRIYAQTGDGRRVGYWDNKTQRAVVADANDRVMFDAALAAHLAAASPEGPAEDAPPPSAPPPRLAPDYGYYVTSQGDLGTALRGARAREQAVALRTEAPIRTLVGRVLGVKTDERAWRIGADGEESVGKQLAKLGAEWKSLHAVPVGDRGSDIDHVVIGPSGVYTINAKHHPNAKVWVGGNTFMVNGQRQPYVRNSRFEADRAAKFLTEAAGERIGVNGVIAVVNVGDFTVKKQPDDVYVLTRLKLRSWLESRPPLLSRDQVEALYAVARRPQTWRAST
jgi:hypothetical protein